LVRSLSTAGGLGALARYGLAQPMPTQPGEFPSATFISNVSGWLLFGVLTVLITDAFTAHRLIRPLLGGGVLGDFTTLSTYAVEIRSLLQPGTSASPLPNSLAR
jgi:CrcB protein